MAKLDEQSINQFISHPNDYVLAKKGDVIYAEKKSGWSWLKRSLNKEAYELRPIVNELKTIKNLENAFIKEVNKTIDQHNTTCLESPKRIGRLSHHAQFEADSVHIAFDRHGPASGVRQEPGLRTPTKQDRGISPKESQGRISPTKLTTFAELSQGADVEVSLISDAFKQAVAAAYGDNDVRFQDHISSSFDEALEEIIGKKEGGRGGKISDAAAFSAQLRDLFFKKLTKGSILDRAQKEKVYDLFKNKELQAVLEGLFRKL